MASAGGAWRSAAKAGPSEGGGSGQRRGASQRASGNGRINLTTPKGKTIANATTMLAMSKVVATTALKNEISV